MVFSDINSCITKCGIIAPLKELLRSKKASIYCNKVRGDLLLVCNKVNDVVAVKLMNKLESQFQIKITDQYMYLIKLRLHL